LVVGVLAAAGAGAAPTPTACDDATFLRRATLDLAGRQPTPGELDAFLADDSAGKRAAAVERLLADPAWATTWARYFRDVILYRRTDERALAMAKPLEAFLADRLEDGAAWDRIARDMITASGAPAEHGETAIIMAQMGETADIAAEVSRVFLGIQIQCAQCHNHFTDRWKREQFHHFAAFFPRVAIAPRPDGKGLDRFEVVSFDSEPRRRRGKKPNDPRRGDLEHEMPDKDDPSRPGTVMRPEFFLAGAGVPLGTKDQERRRTVAHAVTDDDNPWFARAIVNRLWTELVGTGFYAGIDDLGPDREAREPDLLDGLCRDFAAAEHDLRAIFRAIMATPAYQAESHSRGTADAAATTASCPQRLRADQLFTQILAALDVDEAAIAGRGTAAQRPAFGSPRALFTQVFGYDPSLPREEIVGSIPQALLLMNGPQLSRAIDGDRRGTALARLLAEHADDREAADAIYVRVLARHPSPDEMRTCLDHVAAAGDRAEAFEDVFWALVNGPEFIHRR
jgi:hypothetical protein